MVKQNIHVAEKENRPNRPDQILDLLFTFMKVRKLETGYLTTNDYAVIWGMYIKKRMLKRIFTVFNGLHPN